MMDIAKFLDPSIFRKIYEPVFASNFYIQFKTVSKFKKDI